MITGMTKHFMFNIYWISVLRFLYFNLFLAFFCITFLFDGIATSISKQFLSLFLACFLKNESFCSWPPLKYTVTLTFSHLCVE
jgi:hypothetical protein